jgi:hypothetical protein
VNSKAISNLKNAGFMHSLDLECFAHTINNAGEKFATPRLKVFASAYNNFITRSAKARSFFLDECKQSPKRSSSVRWFAHWEQCDQWFTVRKHMIPFLKRCMNEQVGATTTTENLIKLFQQDELLVELAAIKDAGHALCQALHMLEGDTFLAVHTFNIMNTLRFHCSNVQYTNVDNVLAMEISNNDDVNQSSINVSVDGKDYYKTQLRNHALECVRPGLEYIINKFFSRGSTLERNMQVFEACRLFHPLYARVAVGRDGQVSMVLNSIGVFSQDEVKNMADEYSSYVAVASDLANVDTSEYDKPGNNECFQWWVRNKTKLPYFCAGAFKVALLQPSSACVERVFSMLSSTFSDSQTALLFDAREASLMLRYNSGIPFTKLELQNGRESCF